MSGNKVLFITYNGLLDALGSSQILPYIELIARQPKVVHILSFEKHAPDTQEARALQERLQQHGIAWTPLTFTKRFSRLGKAWDLMKMYATALRLGRKHRFDVIHCRSLHAAQVGLAVRRVYGGKVIFDMRGLWVDERVDGGIWNLNKSLDAFLFRRYKNIERWVLKNSDHIVVLTERVVEEVEKIEPTTSGKITVIPCCADYAHFSVATSEERLEARRELGIHPDALVVSYLGSLGTWYRFADMLQFIRALFERRSDAYFLVITRNWSTVQNDELAAAGLDGEARSRIVIKSATRDEVPALLGASDVMLSFIEPSYSKLASSPTKLAEAFASGVAVVSNSGVGDVASITREYDAGALVELGSPASLRQAADQVEAIIAKGGQALRVRTEEAFSIKCAAASYQSVYQGLSD